MKNNNVIDAFFRGDWANGSNLRTENGVLINYVTVIAVKANGKVYLNAHHYSPTTTKHQNYIRYNAPVEVIELDTEYECREILKERAY